MPRTLSFAHAALVAMLMALAVDDVAAKTLAVAVSGTDDAGCGGKTTPCRSLARAIANAAAGDSIVVGPGRYGDLDGDGVLGETGEEPSPEAANNSITIDKPLAITSRDGALATVIDAGGADTDLVRITANGVVFGKPKKGFTLRNTAFGRDGLIVSGTAGNTVVVAGNRVMETNTGFAATAPGVTFTGNQSVGNRLFGFAFFGPGFRLIGNEALANGADGLRVATAGDGGQIVGNAFIGNGSQGVLAQPDLGNLVFRGNVASGNAGSGFAIGTSGVTITGNVANANGGSGFLANGTGITLTKNSAYANGQDGIAIGFLGEGVVANANNVAGNDLAGGGRCGISKFLATAADATGNFWGAPTGPGPAPADQACDDSMAGTLVTTPFATKEIKVKVKPPKVL
jgi:hypothetical protein